MQLIKEQVSKIIQFSQNIPDPQVDELIDRWAKAKTEFIKMFGGNPIYEVGEVEFHLSDTMKANRVQNFIDRLVNTYGQSALGQFVMENQAGFFDNKVIKEYANIPKGMKLIRAFKYFESENKALLERLQNEASQIIQEDKIKGTLCFSVHPLDFLSSSENDYKWRSCHSLDGEYRAGNLSYMLDKSTFVCYVKGKDNVCLPRFPEGVKWNSKKWRMLMFLSDGKDMLFAGRQYPFSTDNALEVIGKGMLNIPYLSRFFDSPWWRWSNYVIDDSTLYSKYIRIAHQLVAIDEIVTDVSSLHYNDLKWSNFYNPSYIFNNHKYIVPDEALPHFDIGANVKCLHCEKDYIRRSDTMMCDNCDYTYGTEDDDDYGCCNHCNARIWWDDLIYITDDYYVCPDCIDDIAYVCPRCGDYVFKEDAVYHEKNDEYYCKTCMEEMMEENL